MQIFGEGRPGHQRSGPHDIGQPVFATRVLQMANSPLFALTAQVKTLSHAIVVLGLARVRSITVTRALGDFVAPALNVRSLRVCWQNSLAGALLAEKLARASKMDPDVAYVAGLLRATSAKLALLVKYPDSYANLLAVSGEHGFRSDDHRAGLVRRRSLPGRRVADGADALSARTVRSGCASS